MKWFRYLLPHFLLLATAIYLPAGDEPPTRFPPAPRILAFGDVHGDLAATLRALQLAGVIDKKNHWAGGSVVLVQTGDQLDRGDQEQAILDLFTRLADEATAAAGTFHVLNGNHELMNAHLKLRYVTPGGFTDFQDAIPYDPSDPSLAAYEPEQRARVAAFRPGGPYALVLARRNTVVIIGDNVFVHAGILPEHVTYGLERLNSEIRAWLRGEQPRPPVTKGKTSPVWTRLFSKDTGESECEILAEVLEQLSARRMIVGHTVQENGITSACDGKVWRIDVGMAAYYGGTAQVLEITGDTVRVIK